MKYLLAALLIVGSLAAISDEEYSREFLNFVQKYNKVYADDGAIMDRFQIFKDNYAMIVDHNAQGLSWTMGVNEFADLTWEEFFEGRTGLQNLDVSSAENAAHQVDLKGLFTVPESIDWTQRGAVTEAKDQGQCGSCWSFGTTGTTEGAVAVKTGRLTSLSEQMLVDCDTEQNAGCQGGVPILALQWVAANGLCSEADYPYEAAQKSCRSSSCTVSSTISSAKMVKKDRFNIPSEDNLMAAVATVPVAVDIQADQFSFQFYSGGVFTSNCGTQLNHAVLVVGYGTDAGKDYWKVKNSWGGSWGENGYIRLGRGMNYPNGQCGIAMRASYAIA